MRVFALISFTFVGLVGERKKILVCTSTRVSPIMDGLRVSVFEREDSGSRTAVLHGKTRKASSTARQCNFAGYDTPRTAL